MNDRSEAPASPAECEQVSHDTKGRFASGTKLRQTIDAWKERARDELHSKVAARSAKIQRDKYRADREAEGLTVRSYQWHAHEPQRPWETRKDFEKRTHRDRQRSYRGTIGQFFAERADLSTMSEEERMQHVRELAADRQRARRQRVREAKAGPHALSAIDLTRLDEALQDLVLD